MVIRHSCKQVVFGSKAFMHALSERACCKNIPKNSSSPQWGFQNAMAPHVLARNRQTCSVTSLPWKQRTLSVQGKSVVRKGFYLGFFKSPGSCRRKWAHVIILDNIRQIHAEGQFRAIPWHKWNFKCTPWIEAGTGEKKIYAPKFAAISNVLKFHLNGRSNNYLHGEVIETLT